MSRAGAGAPAVATRNPAKITTIPTSSDTANAVIAPNTELSVPLAPRISVPAAMSTLDHSSRPGAPDLCRVGIRARCGC